MVSLAAGLSEFAEFAELPDGPLDVAWEALGEKLAALPPGSELAALLEAFEQIEVGDYFVVEMAAAYHRMAAWSQARVAAMGQELATRPALHPRPAGDSSPLSRNLAGDELAVRLGMSRRAGRHIVRDGWVFTREFEATGQALAAGEIDGAKARTIVNHLKDVAGEIAFAVQEEVLPGAGGASLSQLVGNIQRALIAVDPEEATARHCQARAGRRVDHPRPLPDGMASVYAVLSATDAAALDLALEGAARTARANGDQRTIDQLRADAFALFGYSAHAAGHIGCPHRDGHAQHSGDDDRLAGDAPPAVARPPAMKFGQIGGRPVQVRITVPLSVAMPQGLAAVRAGPPDVLLPQQPGANPGGRGADHLRDHPPPPQGTAVPTAAEDPGRTASKGERPNSGANGANGSNGAIGDNEHIGDIGDIEDRGRGGSWDPDARWRCLTQPPAEVAELHGYGPITPDVARALTLGGTWQRLILDPASGALLDVGRKRYQPPAELATFVRERDGTCVRPGCSSPSQSCQLDHVVPWLGGGETTADNLASLCGLDHAVKTLGAFQLRRLAEGVFQWRTPTGHVYHRDAHGTVTAEPPGSTPWPTPLAPHHEAPITARGTGPSGFPDEPPF